MKQKTKHYGVVSQNVAKRAIDGSLEELRWNGFTVIEGVLDGGEIDEARRRLDSVYNRQIEEFGTQKLEEISELNLARMPLLYDPWFISIASKARIMDLVRDILGEYFILHVQNGILNRPNAIHHQSRWHRDLPYQQWTSSRPIALGAMFCLDQFSEVTGGTVMLPHSHRFEEFPSEGYASKFQMTVDAKAGSVLLFDAMVYHRAGNNLSGATRRGINHVYSIPIIRPQIEIPEALGEDAVRDPFLRRLLGYELRVKKNVAEWRNRHEGK